MSMLASIVRISQTDIEAILRDPGCVGDLLDSPETPKEPKPGFFARIFRVGGHQAKYPLSAFLCLKRFLIPNYLI